MLEVLDQIKIKKITLKTQDDSQSTYATKLTVEMGRIDWNSSADKILNQIRALVPWPSAFTHWQKLRVKVLEALKSVEAHDQKQEPGTILSVDPKGTIAVQTNQGAILIKIVQPESGKAMNAYAFVLGRHLKPGDRFV